MNIEIIKSLKERAKEMSEDNYDRKIGEEEIYTIICELENFYTAYEKEKEKNKSLIKERATEVVYVDRNFIRKDRIKPIQIKDEYSLGEISKHIPRID